MKTTLPICYWPSKLVVVKCSAGGVELMRNNCSSLNAAKVASRDGRMAYIIHRGGIVCAFRNGVQILY